MFALRYPVHHYTAVKSKEEYIAEDGFGFDYVMVFKAEQAGVVTEMARSTIRQIMAAGLDVRVYFSYSKEEIFCELRAPVERLMEYADQVLTPYGEFQRIVELSTRFLKVDV